MKKLIFLLLTFTVCSCSENKSPIPMGNIIDNNIVTSKTSDSSGVTNLFAINSENALLISQHFQQQERSKSNLRLSSNIAKKVKEYKNKDNETVCFIINYENNKGYSIISSDRRMVPILAFSENGNFDENTENPGIQYWLQMISEAHKESKNLKKIPEDVEENWKKYEKENSKNNRIAACAPLPANVYISNLTNNYSQWGQGAGYNFHSPNRSGCTCEKAAVGCGPVAVGQVLKYHKKQVNFNGTVFTQNDFNNMPFYLPSTCNLTGYNNLTVSWLLRNIGSAINANYNIATNCQTAILTPSNIVSFFNTIGYNSSSVNFYSSTNLVESEIKAFRPVILYGSNCDVCIWNAHIWVLDGLKIDYWYDSNCNLKSETKYQMNWGWYGSYNSAWATWKDFNGGCTIYNNASMKAYIIKP